MNKFNKEMEGWTPISDTGYYYKVIDGKVYYKRPGRKCIDQTKKYKIHGEMRHAKKYFDTLVDIPNLQGLKTHNDWLVYHDDEGFIGKVTNLKQWCSAKGLHYKNMFNTSESKSLNLRCNGYYARKITTVSEKKDVKITT